MRSTDSKTDERRWCLLRIARCGYRLRKRLIGAFSCFQEDSLRKKIEGFPLFLQVANSHDVTSPSYSPVMVCIFYGGETTGGEIYEKT